MSQTIAIRDTKNLMDRTANFYANPTYSGGGLAVFSGARRRRGGGILGVLKSIAMPMIKGLARRGATHAIGLAKDVATDLAAGRNFKSSVMRHGLRRAKRMGSNMLQSALNTTSSPSRKRKASTAKARQTPRRRRSNF